MTETPPAKPQRSARLVFTQAVLFLEAFAALFAVLAIYGLSRAGVVDIAAGWLWPAGLGLAVALALAAGMQARPGALVLGSVLQAPMLAAVVVSPPVAVVGVMFVVLWVTAIRLGGRIDRERAERNTGESST